MIPIPDHPIGKRFCRKCALFLPLANFFKGKRRRYECKAHSRGRPRKAPSKKRRLPSSEKKSKTSPQRSKAVAQVWHAAYTDCRSSFGQATVGMSQGELRELFEALGAEASTAFRLVPVDPCRALERGNARMAALDERGGPDEGAVVEGPGLAMSVDEAVNGRQQHDDGEAEKEELDDDDDDDDGEDDDDYNDDEAETEAATEAVAMDMTTTGTGKATAHGDVGVNGDGGGDAGGDEDDDGHGHGHGARRRRGVRSFIE